MISRDAVITIIENSRLTLGKHDLSVRYVLADIQEQIERLNTAYDVKDVVKHLNAGRYITIDGDAIGERDSIRIKDAIEIVRSGEIK